jgi:hypothetical protein
LLLQRHLTDLTTLDAQAVSRGDFDRDDTLSLKDLKQLQSVLVGGD